MKLQMQNVIIKFLLVSAFRPGVLIGERVLKVPVSNFNLLSQQNVPYSALVHYTASEHGDVEWECKTYTYEMDLQLT